MRALRGLLRPLAAGGTLAAAAAALLAYTFFPRPDGYPYIWPTHWTTMYASNVTLNQGSTMGQQFRTAAAEWGKTAGSDFRFFVNNGFHDAVVGDLDGFNDAYFSTYVGYGVLGVTYVYYTNDNTALFDCDVAFNGYMYYWYYYDFQSVAVHELGHVLGLGHSTDASAVMWGGALYPGQYVRTLANDDKEGEKYLYPAPGGGGGGGPPPPGPLPLPTRVGTMTGLTVSADEVLLGDTLTFTATVSNTSGEQLLLSGVETHPVTSGPWTEVVMQPGETRGFALDRVVQDLPGLYEKELRLGGVDPVTAYLAQATLAGDMVRVRRPTVPLSVQDVVAGSLGPGGEDRMTLFLVKGEKFLVDYTSSVEGGGRASLALLDPDGYAVAKWSPAKPATAKRNGPHALVVSNAGAKKGTYRIFTEGLKRPPSIRAKGALGGTGPAEVAFYALARTTAVLEVKGSKKLGLRITGLRSPSGDPVPLTPGAEVVLDEFGEDGAWIAVVEGEPGAAGKFTLKAKPDWVAGVQKSR